MRNGRAAASLAFCALVVLATVASPDAQRRGGAPPGGAPGGRGAARGPGVVERITVRGPALEGNSQGDSPDREVTVYLPPGYAADQKRRFPTVYLLHGAGQRENAFLEVLARLQEGADRLAAAQGFSEFIVVTPNASTTAREMYAGNWERYIAEDLVSWIDGHYRTLAQRMSRGLAGHDTGGAAALRIGMKRPEIFADLYLMSAAGDGSPSAELEKHAANLQAYYAIAMDVGAADSAVDWNRQLHAAMTTLRIPHAYEEYDGDRTSRVRERLERNVLVFFARNLASPANLTSPSPPADRLSK
jgi:predicted alpha/beta superfamily hydrolase